MNKRKVEILAPAGSLDGLYGSLKLGADAVYVGTKRFGARAYADNPTVEQLCEALTYAHLRGKKIYLTTNTLVADSDFHALYEIVAPLYESGLDACIVQDIGVLSFLHANFPDMDLHASTQMTLFSGEEAELYRSLGVTRYVPARELTIEEIRQARTQTDMEIEVFVHGALCYCYSGQCLMSQVIGGRSGNHGMCAQPCRLLWNSKYGKGHWLSTKDICTLFSVPELVDAGIDSFKIEGRMKRKEYSAYIAYLYRTYVDYYQTYGREAYDELVQNKDSRLWKDFRNCQDLYNRGGFSKSYLFEKEKKNMMDTKRNGHHGVLVGEICQVTRDFVRWKAMEDLNAQDVVEFRRQDGGQEYEYTLKNGLSRGEMVKARFQKGCHPYVGQGVYRTKNNRLLDKINHGIDNEDNRILLDGIWTGEIGKPVSFTVCGCGIRTTVYGTVLQEAQNHPVTEEDVRQRLSGIGNTSYEWRSLRIHHEADSFVSLGELKKMRRQGIQQWEKDAVLQRQCKPPVWEMEKGKEVPLYPPITIVGVSNREQLQVALETDEKQVLIHLRLEDFSMEDWKILPDMLKKREVAISLPRILRGAGYEKWMKVWKEAEEYWESVFVSVVFINSHRSLLFAKEYFPEATYLAEENHYQENEWAKKTDWKLFGVKPMVPQTYGRIAVMVSEGCVEATGEGCKKRKQKISLTSPKKDGFVSVNHCEFCYSTIYTEEPVRKRENPGREARLEFTWETGEETRKVMKEWNLL